MSKSIFTNTEIEDKKEELLAPADVGKLINKLRVNAQTTLNKLIEFSQIPGRRMISELNQIIDLQT